MFLLETDYSRHFLERFFGAYFPHITSLIVPTPSLGETLIFEVDITAKCYWIVMILVYLTLTLSLTLGVCINITSCHKMPYILMWTKLDKWSYVRTGNRIRPKVTSVQRISVIANRPYSINFSERSLRDFRGRCWKYLW